MKVRICCYLSILSGCLLGYIIWLLIPTQYINEVSADNRSHYVLYFSATWCEPCHRMKISLSDERVVTALQGFIGGKYWEYDADDSNSKKFFDAYKVSGVPTIIIVDKQGHVVRRYTGYMNADDLLKWLTEPIKNVMEVNDV